MELCIIDESSILKVPILCFFNGFPDGRKMPVTLRAEMTIIGGTFPRISSQLRLLYII